jgi:hypothetical protein
MKRVDFSGLVARDEPLGLELEAERLGRVEGRCLFATYQWGKSRRKPEEGQNSPADTLLKRPAREPWPPAHRAYVPEGTEEKPILFKET